MFGNHGEAAKHIPEDIRRKHPDVYWRKISDFCDVAIHEYFGIGLDVSWDIITHKVPVLPEKIKRILE